MITKKTKTKKTSDKEGFTLIEVMLVLAITSIMLVGLIGGTFSQIGHERYNDSVRGVAEFLRTMYSEAVSPQTFGNGNSKDMAILGKVLVFKKDDPNIYTATMVGNTNINTTAESFLDALGNGANDIRLFCGDNANSISSSVETYTPLWDATLWRANELDSSGNVVQYNFDQRFTGTIIIGRTPESATIHTVYAKDLVYDLVNECQPSNRDASTKFKQDLQDNKIYNTNSYDIDNPIGICVKSEFAPYSREIRIAADGRNTSAIQTLEVDPKDGVNRCQ